MIPTHTLSPPRIASSGSYVTSLYFPYPSTSSRNTPPAYRQSRRMLVKASELLCLWIHSSVPRNRPTVSANGPRRDDLETSLSFPAADPCVHPPGSDHVDLLDARPSVRSPASTSYCGLFNLMYQTTYRPAAASPSVFAGRLAPPSPRLGSALASRVR